MKYRIIFNPLAGNGTGKIQVEKIREKIDGELEFTDMTAIDSYSDFFKSVADDEKIIICGGDGTLNRFINDTDGILPEREILYFAMGSGNDFLRDIAGENCDGVIDITKYIKNLPVVKINGKSSRVLNGVGYGIDGYCCEVGDELRKTTDKPLNYASIAIKGLLFHYKPTNAVITVDGVKNTFKKVWIAPIMNGRFYGGGMMPTPNQNRLNSDGTVSVMVMYGAGKIRTLMAFPGIFKGEHIKKTNMVKVFTGHNITVEFDRAVAAQIDGETVLNVKKCAVTSNATETVNA